MAADQASIESNFIHDKKWFQDHLGAHEGRGFKKIDGSYDVTSHGNW
jgi:hypothetical protein